MTGLQIGPLILKLGSIAGLIALVYSVSQTLRKRPKFSFKFSSSSGIRSEKDGKKRYKFTIVGTVKNQCLENNCITEIHTIVWDDKEEHTTRRHGTHRSEIFNITDSIPVELPLSLNGYQAKKIRITIDMIAEGNPDEYILTQYEDIGSGFTIPKYSYELMFEDVNGNIFDSNGRLWNREVSDLRRTIGNTKHALKKGNPLPLIGHYLSIKRAQIKFKGKIRRQYLGLGK